MLHEKSMAGFVALNNMAYGFTANDELMVRRTNNPFTPLHDNWNGAIYDCNYSQRSYTVVYDAARHTSWQRIYSMM
jgi:hypothetical protein